MHRVAAAARGRRRVPTGSQEQIIVCITRSEWFPSAARVVVEEVVVVVDIVIVVHVVVMVRVV